MAKIFVLTFIALFQYCGGQNSAAPNTAANNINKSVNPSTQMTENKTKPVENSTANEDYTISSSRIGKAKLGQTVSEIRKMFPKAEIVSVSSPIDPASFTNAVKAEAKTLFYFDTAPENLDQTTSGDSEKIVRIIISDGDFKTENKISVGSSFAQTKAAYPKAAYFAAEEGIAFMSEKAKAANMLFFHIEKGKTLPAEFDGNLKITHIAIHNLTGKAID